MDRLVATWHPAFQHPIDVRGPVGRSDGAYHCHHLPGYGSYRLGRMVSRILPSTYGIGAGGACPPVDTVRP